MDIEFLRAFGEAALSIFAIVNPIAGLSTFTALTENTTAQKRRRVFRLAGVVALVMICVMALFGRFLLQTVFQIEIAQFAFASGLLLIIIGLRGVLMGPEQRSGSSVADETDRRMAHVSLAVTPIASPLLVGPGSIVNVMLIDTQHGHIFAMGACVLAFLFVILFLNYTHMLYRFMGRVGVLAVGRMMQIFIVAIGVKFCFTAIAELFPGLVK